MDLILSHAGTDPAEVLALIREATGLGRAEAGGLIANLPQAVVRHLSPDDARALKRRFEEAGATVELR